MDQHKSIHIESGVVAHESDAITDRWQDENVVYGKLVVSDTRTELEVTLLLLLYMSRRALAEYWSSFLRFMVRLDVHVPTSPEETKTCNNTVHSPSHPRACAVVPLLEAHIIVDNVRLCSREYTDVDFL
jgi:hypothetical protein